MQPINSNNNFLFQSVFEALEERVLFDGVPDAAFILPADAATTVPAQVQSLQQADADLPRELIIVDPGVEDSDALLQEILENNSGSAFEVRMLDADSDGVDQITDLLAQSSGKYDAIHVISHGEEGQINLGNSQLTSDSFSGYVDQLASWDAALTENADILFYGCELAGNADGQSLVESISAVTGADVAASDDVTGAAEKGGDWDLEFTAGVVQSEVLSAYAYQGTLALADATLSIVSDGTPTWDPNNNAGNDTDGSNGIIRSHDSLLMEVFYNTDSGGATDLNFTSILPVGLVWDSVPAAAALDSRTMVFDSVTGLPGGDMRGIVAYLPDVAGTFTSSVTFEARAFGGPQGMALNGVEFEVASNENGTAIVTDAYDFTLSAAANMDIRLLSPTFRGVHTDAAGTVDGVVYSYPIGILGDHPTRTGTDAIKGAAPIEDDFTFDLDFTNVSPGATIFDWGATLGGSTDNYVDGISRNYERFTGITGVTETVASSSSYPAGQVDEVPGNAVWSTDRATPDSGDWTITGSSGSVFSAQVSGSDTTGSTFPSRRASNGVLPASEKWFASGIVHVWIPLDDILPGEDGIPGNLDDGVLDVIPEITNFDPDDAYGITNNFGAGTEDTTNNARKHTILAFSQGRHSKYNGQAGHPTSGRWVETGTVWGSGDAETSVGHTYDARVSGGINYGVLESDGLIFGDKFDNTSTKITANSLPGKSGDGWSRVYAAGGPNNGTHLTYGTDYIIEFGTGGVGGSPAWTDWDSMGDATLADGETSTVWSQDPTDPALGGTAYADGVRDSITKWRVKMLRATQPGEQLIALITNETVGHSTLDPTNPGGNIIANFAASSIGYQRDDANPDNDWRTSEYSPLDNFVQPGSPASQILTGDRLWIVEANVDVDKTVIDLGAGSSYLAGSAATIQLEASVTIPGPDSGDPAQDVYITDMLPPGLTVVGGSASPAAGTTFTAGDGSTISVQSVEYYDPATSAWSTTWTYGATGIRWFYGDVPLNTALPTMTFDVLIPFDAKNGESYTNTAVASSPSDDSTEEFRNSSAGLVAVQVAAMSAGKFVVTPLVPEDTTIIYELGIANVSDDKDVPWFDLVDLLPYDSDFEGSSFSGVYTDITVNGLDPGLEVYVTTASAATLDAADGTVDGYADPGTAAAGDAWFVAEGTGIWQYTLADVQAGVAGAPTDGQITAIRVVSDKTMAPFLEPGESTTFFLELTPDGNVGIPSDTYTNKFTARTDPASLPLPVSSAAVTAVVVAPDIEIEKEVALDESHVNIDPTDDSHWGETVDFDDTDKAYFRLKVTNTGTADFLGATVTDNLPVGATFVAGTAAASAGDFSGFPATWTFDLAAGDTATLIYQLDVDDSGNYLNTADVEATDQWGETVDDTDDAEANFVTEISAAKQQTGAVRSTSNPDVFEVTYEVEILNSSIFDLASLTLTEDLDGAFGPGFAGILTPPAVTSSVLTGAGVVPTINGGFNGDADDQVLNGDGFLETGNSVTLTYTVLVDPALLPDPANTVNQVEAGGLTGGPGGTPTTDLSDDGSDPATDNPGARGDDGAGGTDDPTPLVLPAIDLTKQIVGSPVPSVSGTNGNFDVTYEFMIENTGTVDLDSIAMTEDFLANLGGAFVDVVNGPTVTMTTASDNPDINPNYDGSTDTDIFATAPTVDTFTYGGSTSNTTNRANYSGDNRIVIDPNQEYELSVDAFAGDGAGGGVDPSSRHYIGFVSYDVDGNVVSHYSYAKFSGATDTTLAAPLNPGDTTITLTDASGWSNAGANHTRTIAWYGYTDSTGYTYPDYDYTRNYLANAWPAGAVSGNTITLNSPWAGPALNTGDAVRNSVSGGSYQYVLRGAESVPGTSTNYTTQIGGGYIANGQAGTSMFRPGTHSVSSLVLADWLGGGTGTQLTVDNFQLTAPNMSLLESGQKVTFQVTVEIDPDAPGAIYDGITSDGDNSLDNQASITAEDPFNGIPVADTSDDPTDPTDAENGDDSDPDDPTALLFPNIELTKSIAGTPVPASSGTTGNMDVTFEFVITNSGNEPVQDLSFIEDLATQYGGAFQGVVLQGGAVATTTFTDATNPIEFNSSFDGGTTDAELIDNSTGGSELAMGQTIVFQITVEVDPDNTTALYTAGQLSNQASVSGTGTMSGVVVDDDSDDPSNASDIDNDNDNDPDDPNLWSVPVIDLTKTLVGDPVAASSGNQGNFDVTYDFTISNFGNASLDSMSLLEDVATQYGGAFVAIVPQAGIAATIQSSSATNAPEINTNYDGGLSDAEVFDNTGANVNELAMGQSVTIRIIFEVDPDAAGAIFDADNNLVNQATVSGNNSGITYTDDSDDPNNATDDDPNGDNNADDPNTLFIASVSVAKDVVGTPVSLSNGNFEVTYQLVVENTGNAFLDISLDDDLDAQFGPAFVSADSLTMIAQPAGNPITIDAANWDGDTVTEMVDQSQSNILAAGEFFIVQFTVEVDPDASGTAQPLDNQATVTGDAVDETGNPITDSSGNPVVVDDLSDDGTDPATSNPGADGDTGGSDDPTPLILPDVSLAKDAGDAVANGDNWDVPFTLVYENTGTVDLGNLTLMDDIAAQFGNAFVSASGLTIQNFVGTGTAPTANAAWAGDAVNMLVGGTADVGDSFEIVFTVTIDPDGLDSISQALDNIAVAGGDALDANGDPILDGSGNPITVTDDSDDGTDPNGENGEDNGDGTFGNDPTPIIIADIDIAKEVFGTPVMLANGNFEVVYQLVVENTGTVNLANLTLGEDLATQFGPAYVDAYNLTLTTPPTDAASNVVLDSANWDGDTVTEIVNTAVASSLAIGDSFIFEFTVEVDPDATGTSMALDNQVTTSGDAVDDSGNPYNDSSGNPIVATDDSDSGTDPSDTNSGEPGDTGGSDDPTPLNLPAVSLAKSAGDAVPNGDNFDVTFTFVYENTGTTQLTNLELLDDIATEFGNAYVSASGLAVQNFAGTGTAPTANAAWTGDTTLNMISGGTLEIGDSFEVVFTITIDPDGIDSVSQGLENQGTANADGIDNNGDPITVTDESDNGVDPNGENGEDDGDGTFANDPTPIIIADISVTKEVSGTPIKLANDNFSVTYQLVVENTGTVDLANLSLVDDLANQFGGAFINAGSLTLIAGPFAPGSNVVVDSANWDGDGNTEMINQVVPTSLVVGDSYIVQFTVEVDPDATGTSGSMDNQVTTGGDAVDSAGNPITDSTGTPITTTDDSDSGTDPSTDNPGAPGDMGTSDDPTPLALPDLSVGKQANSVTVATDGAGNELTGSFDVQYLVVLENTGTIELTNLQLLDDLTTIATFGDAYDPTLLTGPTDRSGFVSAPAIVSHTLANPGDLPNLNAGFLGGGAQTGLFDGTSGALQTGEQIVLSFTVRIDSVELLDGDATDGMAQNQIQGTADSAEGPVDDLSDDGLNPNGDNGSGGSNDPTPFQVPQIRLYKSHSDAVNNGDGTSTITVTLRVDNSGTVDLANLSLTEDLASQFGAAFISTSNPVIDATGAPSSNVPANLINPAWAGDTSQDLFDPAITNETLIVGDDFLITFDVIVDPDLLDDDSDYLENTATVTGDGTNFNGDTITVSDDSGADNGTGIDTDEPTSAIVPEIAIAKTAGDAVANGDNWDVPFTLVIENTGSVNLDMLTLFDDVAAQFGPAYVAASGLTLQNFVGSGTAPTLNTLWEGDNALTMVSGGLLEPGDRFEITFVITIDPDGIDSISQVLDNQANVNGRGVDSMGDPLTDSTGNPLLADDLSDDGTDPNGTNPGENGDEGTNDDPTPIVIADVGLAKTILGTPVLLANGNYAVTYELVAENIGTTDLVGLSLTDDLATQFGAAFVNVSGLTLWTPPSDPSSTLAIDTNWDGTSATDIIDGAAPSMLAVGDSYAVQFVVEIDAVAATGNLDNQAVTGGDAVDPDGNPYTDSNGNPITAEDDSDSGTDPGDPNAGEPGDTGTSDDPTPLYIPSVGLAKLAGDAVANGENFDVTFTLVYENNGTVDLTNLTLTDDIAAQFGNAYVSVTGLTVQNFVGTGTAPTANAAWETDTTVSMITGGAANIDDTFEVVFTVTIDPDGIDDVSQALENQATATGDGLDEDGNPLTDAAGDPVTATDDSDNGTDPNAENGEDDGDGTFGNDPTPIIIADVSVVKDIVGTPTALDNGNFEVIYELIIENTGTVDLANLSLVDALPPQFGSVFVSAGNVTLVTPPADASSNVVLDSNWDGDAVSEMIDQAAVTLLAVGDSYVVRFTAEVDPDALLAPPTPIENQVTTTGDAVDDTGNPLTDAGGTPITATDLSDDGTDPNGDNAGSPGDHGTTDDPTPLLIPDVGLAKTAGDAVPNGDNFDVTFTLVYTNTGTVALDNLELIDDVAAQFGNAYVSAGSITIQNFAGTGTAPTANPAWSADTTQDMLVLGNLEVGDTFEVVFTVTIDPDGLDSMSQGLDNQAVATADGLNDDGTKLIDDNGDVVTADDVSDDGTDVSGENGSDDGDGIVGNDPTPIIIADVSLAKQVVGTPTLLANGNYEAVYQLVVENTGTVDLANLTLGENLATQFGPAFVNAYGLTLTVPPTGATSLVTLDSANWNGNSATEIVNTAVPSLLAVGDSFIFQFTVEIDAAQATGVLENTVTAGGDAVDEDGTPYTDSSGDPITAEDDSDSGTDPSTDNPSDLGDHGTSDDPTPIYIPSIGIAKAAGDAVPNGDNFDVEFTLVWENTGTVALDNVEIFDDIAAQFGGQYVAISGLTVQNFAGTGTAPTANAAWNTGDTTTSLVNSAGALEVGDTFEILFTVTIDPDASGTSSPGLENQATTSGDGLDENGDPLTDGSGNPVTVWDDSDDGLDPVGENGEDDGDGTFGNDPTPIIIADISVAKQVTAAPVALSNGNFQVAYELVIENTGNVDLANLTLVEDLNAHFGSALISAGNITLTTPPSNASSNVLLDSGWNGNGNNEMIDQVANTLLAVGDSFVVRFTVEVDPDAVGAPGELDNQVTVGGDGVDDNGDPITDSTGTPIVVTDDSDSGADPNGTNPNGDEDSGTSDDPTPLYLPAVGLTKDAGDAVANGDNWDVEFTLIYENTGTVDLTNLTLLDDVAAQFGNAFVSTSGLSIQNFAGTGTAPGVNAAWNGDNTLDMFDGTGQANVGDSFEITFTVTIDPDGIDDVSQGLENQAVAGGDGLDGNGDPLVDDSGNPVTVNDVSDDGTDPNGENGEDNGDGTFGNDPTPIIIADIAVAKEAVGSPVLLSNGNFNVTYQLVIENNGTVDLANLSLVEDLATQYGSVYVDAFGLMIITPPSDPASTVTLDSAAWNGGSSTEMVDTSAASYLAIGDSYVVQFTVTVDPTLATAPLTNQVTTSGDAVDEDGNAYTDSSGTPITAEDDSDSGANPNDPNSGDPGDSGGTDDPTPLYIPNVGLSKDAGDAVANGDNWDVEFTLVYENNGTVDLTNLTLLDDVAAQFGNAYVSTSGLSIQNFVGTGTAPGVNAAWNGDNTLDMLDGTGQANIGDSFEITFTVTIDPDGIDAVSQGLENQAVAGGDGLDENGDPLTDDSGNPVTVTDVSDDGTDPSGENGEDNGDGTFGNDPTPVIIADISVAKEVFGTPVALADGTFDVTYQLVIENTGTVDLANLSLTDDIAAQFGAPFISASGLTLVTPPADAGSNVVLDGASWDGSGAIEMIDQAAATSLVVGDSYIVQFNVIVDLDASGTSGPLENQVQTGGDGVDEDGNQYTDSSGNPITAQDDSDSGADANGNNPGDQGDHGTSDDPTPLLIPDIAIGKVAGDARPLGDDWVVHFRLFVENTGTVSLDNLTLFDDISAQFGNAFVAVDNVVIANFAGTGTAPGTNPAWTGDTALDMLDGSGTLDVGDKFQVVFRVTIDPDGIDSVSQGLDNQAMVGGNGINPDGSPMIDSNGDPIITVDDSDDGTDVHGENGEDGGDGIANNDPTPIIIADIAVAKEAVGTPVLLPDGNFEVVYQLVIENTGTVDLANLSLVEDLATQYGSVYVNASGLTLVSGPTDPASSVVIDTTFDGGSSTEMIDQAAATYLAVGDSYTLQFTTVVDPSLAVGPLTNQVTTSGDATDEDGPILDSNGDRIVATDDSDSGADPSETNTDQPGDTGNSDDPTPLQVPSVGLAKLAGDPVANGDNWDITFTLVYENNGTVDLNNLTLTDDIGAQFANAYVSATGLTVQNFSGTGTAPAANAAWESDTTVSMISGGQANIGDTFEVVFTVTIDPDGIDNASQTLDNQATATGDGLDQNGDPILDDSGNPVVATDDSDNGTDPNGENGEDDGDGTFANDPTPIYIADISVAKEISGTPVALLNGNFEVTYQLVIENTGTVDLANLTLVEDLATQFGAPLVTAGNATIVTPPADPASNVALNPAWDGASVTDMIDASAATYLAIGDSYVVRFTVEVDLDAGGTSSSLDNQVVTGGDGINGNGDPILDASGTPITATDDSDSGTDTNGTNPDQPGDTGGSDDPTPLLIPDVGLSKVAGDAVENGDYFDITFRFTYENTGTTTLNNLSIVDDVAAQFGNAFVSASAVTIANLTGTGILPTANGSWASLTSANMLVGGELEPGASFDVEFTVTMDPDGVDGTSQGLVNQAQAGGDYIGPDGTPTTVNDLSDDGTDPNGDNITGNDPTPIIIADLGIAKSIAGQPVLQANGNYLVNYQVVIENTGTVDLGSMSLIEDLATQFGAAYVNASGLTLTVSPTDLSSNIAVDGSGFNGGSSTELLDQTVNNVLIVGDSFTIEFTAEIDPLVVSGSLLNQVEGTGDAVDENGNPIVGSDGSPIVADDVSDSGTDPNGQNSGDPGDNDTPDDPTPFTPEPLPLAEISGSVFIDTDNDGNYDVGENGIAGVEITLVGTDIYGNAVELTVLTDANGDYVFEGLNPGSYQVIEGQPDGFDDGLDEANAAFSVGNDQINNVVLGFGDSFGGNNFGELQQGTSGNPARLPPIGPISNQRLSNRISGLLGGPGPIYSGVPIASNGNPLTLQSGRPVSGGYASEFATPDAAGDCGCPEVIETPCEVEVPCEPCAEEVIEEAVCDPCGEQEVVSDCECQVCEEPVACDDCSDCGNCCDCGSVSKSGFLFRFKNWLSR